MISHTIANVRRNRKSYMLCTIFALAAVLWLYNYTIGVPGIICIPGILLELYVLTARIKLVVASERKLSEKRRIEAHHAAMRQINLDRKARKSLRRPTSPAYQALMRAIEEMQQQDQSSGFAINMFKLHEHDEQQIDAYFADTSEILAFIGPSNPPAIQAAAQMELDCQAAVVTDVLKYLYDTRESARQIMQGV